MMEEWTTCPGGYDKYLVSNYGRFKNLRGEIKTKIVDAKSGKLMIRLYSPLGVRRWVYSAPLVLIAFEGNPRDWSRARVGYYGDMQDERINNLFWRTGTDGSLFDPHERISLRLRSEDQEWILERYRKGWSRKRIIARRAMMVSPSFFISKWY